MTVRRTFITDIEEPGTQEAAMDEGPQEYLYSIYRYMALGLIITALAAYTASVSGLFSMLAAGPAFWILLIAPLILVIVLSSRINQLSTGSATFCFLLYSALLGLSFGGIFEIYTGISITSILFETAGAFLALSVFGYFTNANLDRWGTFLVVGLAGIILAGLANLLLASGMLDFLISAAGTVIFSALAAADTQRMKQQYRILAFENGGVRRAEIICALSLHLDFINLFLSLLRLTGNRNSRHF